MMSSNITISIIIIINILEAFDKYSVIPKLNPTVPNAEMTSKNNLNASDIMQDNHRQTAVALISSHLPVPSEALTAQAAE